MSQYGYEDRQVSTSAAGVASSSTTRTPSKKAWKHDEIVTAWILYVQWICSRCKSDQHIILHFYHVHEGWMKVHYYTSYKVEITFQCFAIN